MAQAAPRMLTTVSPETAGLHCSSGGNRIHTGLDANRDGALAADEASDTRYVCDGMAGSDGAAINWKVAGARIEAAPNLGYIASSNETPVVVMLPADPAIGDVVRVAGAGQAGWSIAQHDGQSIRLHDAYAFAMDALASSTEEQLEASKQLSDDEAEMPFSIACTTTGTSGSLAGTAKDAVELIYVGSGVFEAVGQEGRPALS